jgi:hypothetical protein
MYASGGDAVLGIASRTAPLGRTAANRTAGNAGIGRPRFGLRFMRSGSHCLFQVRVIRGPVVYVRASKAAHFSATAGGAGGMVIAQLAGPLPGAEITV